MPTPVLPKAELGLAAPGQRMRQRRSELMARYRAMLNGNGNGNDHENESADPVGLLALNRPG